MFRSDLRTFHRMTLDVVIWANNKVSKTFSRTFYVMRSVIEIPYLGLNCGERRQPSSSFIFDHILPICSDRPSEATDPIDHVGSSPQSKGALCTYQSPWHPTLSPVSVGRCLGLRVIHQFATGIMYVVFGLFVRFWPFFPLYPLFWTGRYYLCK